MHFLCICYYDAAKFASLTPEELQAVGAICAPHDKALRDSGHLRFVGSLATPELYRTIRADGNGAKTKTGPYAETAEPFGAFFMLEAKNLDEATQIASLHPGAHLGRQFGGGIEVRPVDFFEQL